MADKANNDTPNPWGREGRRAKRQEGRDLVKLYQKHPELFKKPSRYKTELLFGLLSLLLPLGWGEIMSGDHALWRIWFGWFLWAVPVFVFLHTAQRWLLDKGFSALLRIASISFCFLVFIAVATINIHLSSKPNFLYVVPGLILNDNSTRVYYVLTKGRYPFFAVDLLLTDYDKLISQPPARDSSMSMFHWDEIDQRSNGFPTNIAIKPWKPGHETFTVSFQSRDVDVFENMRVETAGYALFPHYYVKVLNQRTGRLIVECKSKGFPSNDPTIASTKNCESLEIGLKLHRTIVGGSCSSKALVSFSDSRLRDGMSLSMMAHSSR